MFAPVHDLDHRGSGVRGDLDEVESSLVGALAGVVESDDADLFAVGVDEADGADTDLVVDAGIGNLACSCTW
jgi:hypothetical protein